MLKLMQGNIYLVFHSVGEEEMSWGEEFSSVEERATSAGENGTGN